MNFLDSYKQNGFVYVPNLLATESCEFLVKELEQLVRFGKTNRDTQCPKSEAVYGAEIFDRLLEEMTPVFEKTTGRTLIPTYSYARKYSNGEELKPHTDRPACEVSATITLGFDGDIWPIYMADSDKKESAVAVKMKVGDGVIYNGCEKHHWRDAFEGEYQYQVFLHYVDANGPNVEHKYDKRECLSHKKSKKDEGYLYWYYANAISEHSRSEAIKKVKGIELKQTGIGYETEFKIDTTIRDVKSVQLSTNIGIGAAAVGAGIDANYNAWKFDITHANQCELLQYTEHGKYLSHIDTFLGVDSKECRKLTVLAFLNDDFEGGKLYLQSGNEKIYPPQSAGTILVFPSFLLHGVEPVISGTRYSVVTWLIGPNFK